MEFFDEFNWAVPTVFSDAIAKCKFEEGDVLYNSQKAYLDWGRARSEFLFSINVKYPRRTLRVTKGDTASVASSNWNSEVRIELRNFSDDKSAQIIETTQGALFSVLWKGGVSWLFGPQPLLPIFLKDLTDKKQARLYEAERRCKEEAKGAPYFIMACDPTKDISQKKHRDVLSILSEKFDCEFFQFSPKESGLNDWEKVFPVIKIHLYVIHEARYDELLGTLKDVLYKQLPNSTNDNFKIHRHGILVADTL
ncbi:MAG: hypothetical protein ABIL58_23030 [Pseudomonadota bacterium]